MPTDRVLDGAPPAVSSCLKGADHSALPDAVLRSAHLHVSVCVGASSEQRRGQATA